MKNNRSMRHMCIVCLAALILSGCGISMQGITQKPMTAQDIYDEALSFWVDAEQNFRMFYEAATPVERADMLGFANRLYEAKQVLNLWSFHLDGGQATATDADRWKRMKNELIFMIANKYREKEN